MPYTSEVDGKMMRLSYFTQSRIIFRFSSKSSSNTRSGLRVYSIGVAIATSGRTTSHFLMWYSIHSEWMLISPSTKWKRGLSRKRLIASEPMSRP